MTEGVGVPVGTGVELAVADGVGVGVSVTVVAGEAVRDAIGVIEAVGVGVRQKNQGLTGRLPGLQAVKNRAVPRRSKDVKK